MLLWYSEQPSKRFPCPNCLSYYCSCALEPVMLATSIWTHFGVSTLNLAAFSVGINFTLKYNSTSHKLMYRKVLIAVVIVWVYPALWAIDLAYSTRNVTSLRCQLYTDDFELYLYQILLPFRVKSYSTHPEI